MRSKVLPLFPDPCEDVDDEQCDGQEQVDGFPLFKYKYVADVVAT